jgi:spore germination protein YaaH
VDGRKGQSDVDTLVARLRRTGIRDLFVHAGPFENDGTLDARRRPTARWFVGAIHTALPGVRVQAWLGAHPVPGQIDLESEKTRAALVASVDQVLDDGFDGVHYDFEPVEDGDTDLLELLHATHALTGQRRGLLSISASRGEPVAGLGAVVTALPGKLPLWSGAYLHKVALEVDQVAVMSYDSAMPAERLYAGYVRTSTRIALAAVPAHVALLIGVPAYHEKTTYHRPGETMAAALLGVRQALADREPPQHFGVAIYVDFTVTAQDWSSYERDWFSPN